MKVVRVVQKLKYTLLYDPLLYDYIKSASTNNRGNELNKQRGFRVIKGRLIEVEI